LNYVDSFIAVADDCKTTTAKIPEPRGTAKTVAQIQYEMLVDNPYEFTQEDVLFESWFARQGDESTAVETGLKASIYSGVPIAPLHGLPGSGV
jgi:hypothetical protein